MLVSPVSILRSLFLVLSLIAPWVDLAASSVYVDDGADFIPADPTEGMVVVWKPGAPDEVSGLTFGIDAFTSVQEGIDAVASSGTVYIAAGTYDEGSMISVTKSVLLIGDGPGATFLSGGSNGDTAPDPGEHRVIDVSGADTELRLIGLAVVGGQVDINSSANNKGAGIRNLGKIVSMEQVHVEGNAANSGGGIYNTGQLVVSDSVLRGNLGAGSGGAILNNGGSLTIMDSLIEDNSTFSFGGGIRHDGDRALTISKSALQANEANRGGGIYITDGNSRVEITDSNILENLSNVDGAGLFINEGAIVSIDRTAISDNDAGEDGGGIYNEGELDLAEVTLSGNEASGSGGGIYNHSLGEVSALNSIFSENRALSTLEGGGAIYNDDDGSYRTNNGGRVTLERCLLLKNQARVGGALFNDGGGTITGDSRPPSTNDGAVAIVMNCFLEDNNASSVGGGVFNRGDLRVSDSTFSGNSARDGGGIMLVNILFDFPGGGGFQVPSRTLLENSTFNGNRGTTGDGGAINVNGGIAQINHCTITGNNGRFVGGIDFEFDPDLTTITNSLIMGNMINSSAPDAVEDVSEGYVDGGGNLIGVPVGLSLSDVIGELDQNGGFTETHALVEGSPAIDAGTGSVSPSLASDQRGAPRVTGARSDVGAYEAGPQPSILSFSPEFNAEGLTEGSTITFETSENLVEGLGGVTVRTINGVVVPSSFVISGSSIILTLGSQAEVPENSRIRVEIEGDAFRSVSNGAPLPGAGGADFQFTTAYKTVYVDQAADFSPANPTTGSLVKWKPGTPEELSDLRFGSRAFTSIQKAVDAVGRGGTVYIAGGLYGEGEANQIEIRQSVSIIGDGADVTELTGFRGMDGFFELRRRIFQVIGDDADVSFHGMTIKKGRPPTLTGAGAAINFSGTGSLLIENCEFLGHRGGAVYTDDTVEYEVRGSTFVENSGTEGAALSGGIGTIINSTFSGNSTTRFGGALVIRNDTVMIQCTVTGNSSSNFDAGGGISVRGGNLLLRNSIVAGNVRGQSGSQVDLPDDIELVEPGSYTAEGANFLGVIPPEGAPLGGLLLSFEPNETIDDLLNPTLADNGGRTRTHALVVNSPAIDAGNNDSVPVELFSDQRGGSFIRVFGSSVDLGSFEFQPEESIAVNRTEILPNGDVVIEIMAIPGRSYSVGYTSDLSEGFTPASGMLTATSDTLIWVDDGSPTTSAHPSQVTRRFYIIELQE